MKTNKEIYREHLVSAPTVLRETVSELENILVNLAMSGDLADVNNQFEENDSLTLKYEDFRGLSDYNVNLLYEISDFLELKRSELINVNGLEDKED